MSDRSLAMGGVGERTVRYGSRHAATFRERECQSERRANEPTDTQRVGVIRSSIDSYSARFWPAGDQSRRISVAQIAFLRKGEVWEGTRGR